MSNHTFALNQVMTIMEAAEKYGINSNSLRNKFKPSVTKPERIAKWVNEGLVKQSGATWLLTDKFIEMLYSFK